MQDGKSGRSTTRAVLWMAVALLAAGVWWYGFSSGQAHLSDFAGYYTASKIVVATDSIDRMYDEGWFKQKMHEFGMRESTLVMYVNPPPVALMMAPLTGMSPHLAKLTWNLCSLLLLGVAFMLMRRVLPLDPQSLRLPLAFGVLACTVPLLRNLQRGQLYVVMLVLLLVFMQGYLHNRSVLTAASLATLFLLKMSGWIFVILLLAERRWKELGLALVFISAGFLLTLPILGIGTYAAHIEVLREALGRSDYAFTGLPNIPAFFGSFFTFHDVWNPHPLVHAPLVATVLSASTLLLMVAATLKMASAHGPGRLFAFTLLAVLFTPLAADHHYTLLIIPLVALLVRTQFPETGWRLAALVAVVVFGVVGWYPQPAMALLPGTAKVLAFPRLIAACVLWYLLVVPVRGGDHTDRLGEGAATTIRSRP